MGSIEVPGPEVSWCEAAATPYERHNPALQHSMWEYAAQPFRLVAGLTPPLEAFVGRLRLTVERGWEELGWVDVAMFTVLKTDFALSRLEGSACPDTWVWVSRKESDVDAALTRLLDALGVGREALAFLGGPDKGYEYFGTSVGPCGHRCKRLSA